MKSIILLTFMISTLFGITVQDMFKRDVTINAYEKIVCLGPGALRLVSYLQLQDKLVGIEKIEQKYDLKSPYRAILNKKRIKNLPIIGQGGPAKMPNLETLITLKPDVIFTSFMSKEQVELIQKKTKIPVVVLSYGASYGGGKNIGKLQAIKNSLHLIAKITHKEKRFKELREFIEEQEKELKSLNLNSTKLYVGGVAYKGAQGITSTESGYPPFELLGLKNDVLQNQKGHYFINLEALLEFNPKVVFLDLLGKKLISEELTKKKNIFNSIYAFKKDQVFWLYPSNFYNANVENIFVNSWLIASYLNKDIDFKAKQKEIYKVFLGKQGFDTFVKNNPYKL